MILLNPPGSFPGVIPNYFFRKTPKGGPQGRPSAFFGTGQPGDGDVSRCSAIWVS